MSKKNIKTRLFWLFILIGVLPLIIVLFFSGIIEVSHMEENAKTDMRMKTIVIDNYVTDLFERNFHVLHATSFNPILQQYIESSDKTQSTLVSQIMNDTNWIFKDGNMMALTGKDGNQLLRTDNAPLVNVTKREHFQHAMNDVDFVSNVIRSMSTGKDIVVIEVPVKNNNYQVIGMLQRNFEIEAYQSFVSSLSDEQTSIIVLDREANILAHSNKNLLNISEENELPVPYQIVSKTMAGVFDVTRAEINGVDSLIGYKKNSITGWPIIIVYPYKYIFDKVNGQIMNLALLGIIFSFIISILSYHFSRKAAQPIQEVLHKAKKISEDVETENIKVASNDEIEEISHVLNEIRLERDTYRQEIERDTLTTLYTKGAVKAIFNKMKQNVNINQSFDLTAMYLIELDHFKDLNEHFGHLYGDRVLLEFSERLRKCFRPLDCVGRLDANEFIVIANQVSAKTDVLRKAQHINKVARSLILDDQPVDLTASIGIAFFPQDGNSYEDLLSSARLALSKAKIEGRDRFYIKA